MEQGEYEKLLDRAYAALPKEALTKERFEMPVADSFIQGQKTNVKNFGSILKTIRREPEHMLKYITKEIGTQATTQEDRLVLNGKFTSKQVNDIFTNYIKMYVLCHECLRPDTKIADEHGVKLLKCEACGASSPVKRL